MNIAESITNFLTRLRNLSSKAFNLHEFNKAEILIKKAGSLIDNKTGMRLNSIQIKIQEVERRIEALKLLEKVTVNSAKGIDADIVYERAILIWNIGLPFLNDTYRSNVYKSFSSACASLELIQSNDHKLRVSFHLELAKQDYLDDNIVSAESHIKRALALEYSEPLKDIKVAFKAEEDSGLY